MAKILSSTGWLSKETLKRLPAEFPESTKKVGKAILKGIAYPAKLAGKQIIKGIKSQNKMYAPKTEEEKKFRQRTLDKLNKIREKYKKTH